MRNVAPSRALARRSRQLLQLSFFFIAGGVFAAAVGLAMIALQLVPRSSSSRLLYDFTSNILMILGGLAALAGIVMAIRALTWRTENDLARVTANALAPYLDDRFVLIRNINKIGLGYIDAVLVGPTGILVFRITDKRGSFLNEGDRWLKGSTGGQWVPAGIDVTRECVADINSLRDFLGKRGMFDLPIYGVVVFVQGEPAVRLMTRNPALPSTSLNTLYQNLQGSYLAQERLSEQTIGAITRALYTV